ncbi:MAG: disulfide bond formation protein B [Pseudomonadota bacterium]
MTRRLALLAAGGSLGLLLGALAFQYIGGLYPCKMCIWQRWPHGAAIALGAVFLLAAWRPLLLLGALSALVTAGVGVYHAGVEQRWWEGPSACSGNVNSLGGLSASDLVNPNIAVDTVVACDEIVWQLAGLSMAGWNALISGALALIWLAAWRQGGGPLPRAQASSSASQ